MSRPFSADPPARTTRIDDEHRRIRDVYSGYAGDATNSSRWSAQNAGNAAIIAERMACTARLLGPPPPALAEGVLLDIGCGSGIDLDRVADAIGPRGLRVGVDLRIDALRIGQQQAAGSFLQASVFALPFASGSISIVSQSVVISSIIAPELRRSLATEIDRVLAPGGAVISYDMRVTSARNSNVSPLTANELRGLFVGYDTDIRAATVAPPVVRRIPKRGAPRAYRALRAFPFLRTHAIAVARKPAAADPRAPLRGKVTHLTSVHAPKDVRIFLKECRTLAAAGLTVSLVAPGAPSETIDGVRLVGVPRGGGRVGRSVVTTARVLRAALAERSDVYHFHDFELIPVGLLLKLRGKRVVYDVHESVPDDVALKEYLPDVAKRPLVWFARGMEALAARFLDAIVPATPAISRRFIGPKMTIVQNFPILGELVGTDRRFRDRAPQIAYVGGIEEIRGVREIVDAMALVPADLGGRLALAGPFDPPDLAEEVQSGAGATLTRVLGQLSRAEVADLLADSRAGIVTFHPVRSHIEAQPNKLFEYMSAGLPVIASDFPLWREIIDSAECGLLVDPLDPKAIAAAMTALLADPDRAEAMGRRGQTAVVEHYSWSRESIKLLDLYRRLLRP